MSLHDKEDLRQRQSLPLQAKILMTQRRIREWVDYWHDDVYVSFSGGKDSTVLKHIVDQMYDNIPAVFVNTGLEYPEIQQFVTGCMFCMFGCHLEKEPNRFQRMKITHPKQYEYCMNQLGLKEVLEYIGVPYE